MSIDDSTRILISLVSASPSSLRVFFVTLFMIQVLMTIHPMANEMVFLEK